MKVQNLLHICSEHYDQDKDKESDKKDTKKESSKDKDAKDKENKEKEEDKKDTKGEDGETKAEDDKDGSHQGIAVLGIAAIAMGEDIGSEMVLRAYNHLV